jgi:hypothetical protein
MVMPIFISNDLRSHIHPNGPEAVNTFSGVGSIVNTPKRRLARFFFTM